jgi:glutathione S-transferase
MAIDFYWGSGSTPCWRVALALEFKGLTYNSHLLHFDLQEHKSPQMLAMNFRGRLPVLRDNDYVVFESLAILYYLDRNTPIHRYSAAPRRKRA